MYSHLFKHVTSSTNIRSIMKSGLNAHTCFSGNDELSDYYAETIEDEDAIPVTLVVEVASLDKNLLLPDINGIEEPIMTIVRGISNCRDEEALYDAWMDSTQDWVASLNLIGSIVYGGTVDPLLIQVLDPNTGDLKPLISIEPEADEISPTP